MKHRFIVALSVLLLLLAYGAIRFPSSLASPIGLYADLLIIIIYGLVIWFWFPVLQNQKPRVFQTAIRNGLLIGLIFIGEMILEYILLPTDNSRMGLVEYGSVFAIFFILALQITFQTGRFRNGIVSAVISAMLGSIIWFIAALSIFYLFHGTPNQTQVFQAEGNFEDFDRSSMTDFDAFIMQDFWGAGFFHSILLPVLAVILGSVGGMIGRSLFWIREHKWNRSK